MPAWEMHIAVANKVNEVLNKDEELFIFGNIMPDNEGWIIENPSHKVLYKYSHFAKNGIEGVKEVLPDYKEFIKKYQNKFNNPLVLGYLSHLLTDFYWNRLTFKNYYIKDENGDSIGIRLNTNKEYICSKDERRTIKQKDFKNYSNYLVNNNMVEVPKFNIDKIKENVNNIEEVILNREDIIKIVEYIKNINEKRDYNKEYKVFNEDIFNEEFEKCVQFVINEIRKL